MFCNQSFRVKDVNHPFIFSIAKVNYWLLALHQSFVSPDAALLLLIENCVGLSCAGGSLLQLAPEGTNPCGKRCDGIRIGSTTNQDDSTSSQPCCRLPEENSPLLQPCDSEADLPGFPCPAQSGAQHRRPAERCHISSRSHGAGKRRGQAWPSACGQGRTSRGCCACHPRQPAAWAPRESTVIMAAAASQAWAPVQGMAWPSASASELPPGALFNRHAPRAPGSLQRHGRLVRCRRLPVAVMAATFALDEILQAVR